jgi:hypothetical protein
MALLGDAGDHGDSRDDVVRRHGHREDEDGGQEAAEVVNRVLRDR